ncbi:MAG: ABC transporter ATP-binding protein [bacterium]
MPHDGEDVVVARGLSKSFKLPWRRGLLLAVQKLDLTVKRGEVFGLLGPNGSGKSTTMKLMLGLIRPTAGAITVCGHPARSMAARRKIGFLPENPYFPQFLTAREVLRYYGALCGLHGRALETRATELLELVRLQDAMNRTLRVFSKGMLQRIGLAQALLHDPEILLLDEPTAGVDPIGSRQIQNLLLDLKKWGKTVIFSSHLLGHVQEVADRAAILHLGKKMCEGSLEELLTVHGEFEIRGRGLSPESEKEVSDFLRSKRAADIRISKSRRDLEGFFVETVTRP